MIWHPISTCPPDYTCMFWIDWADDCKEMNQPMPDDPLKRIVICKRNGWSSVHKATHWAPMPAGPEVRTR